jgi:hypothetical protein
MPRLPAPQAGGTEDRRSEDTGTHDGQLGRPTSFTGSCVLDDRGASVGTVSAVVYEDDDPDPVWLVVDSRWWWRGRHYVPVDGSYPTPAGDLVVPYDRSWVRAAPRAGTDQGDLDYETRRRLATHYGDDYDWWPRRHEPAALASG